MGALVDEFRASWVTFDALPGGQLRATGVLTDAIRAKIRDNKVAILGELASNNQATHVAPEQAAELRALLAIVGANWPADELGEALAYALADPGNALTCYRALASKRTIP